MHTHAAIVYGHLARVEADAGRLGVHHEPFGRGLHGLVDDLHRGPAHGGDHPVLFLEGPPRFRAAGRGGRAAPAFPRGQAAPEAPRVAAPPPPLAPAAPLLPAPAHVAAEQLAARPVQEVPQQLRVPAHEQLVQRREREDALARNCGGARRRNEDPGRSI